MEIAENKEYTITIDAVSSDGNGVGHIDGFAVFVPMTVTGDTARIIITKLKKHYAYGKALEIIEPSPRRANTECPHYENCGGCQLRHIRYDCQLEIKKEIIENAMRRIGGFEGFCLDGITGMESPVRYRNKTVFQIGEDSGEVLCGFYTQQSHHITPVEDCLIGSELNSQINKVVINYMNVCNIAPYNERTHKGVIRRIFTRKSFSTGEIMVVISVNSNRLTRTENLIKGLRSITDKITSIILNVNTKRNTSLLGQRNITLWGKNSIRDTLCGIEFEISPESFFQVNPLQTEKLYSKAIEYAGIDKNMTVMDIYCGIGTISLCAAKKAGKVIGIEIVERAIEDAKQNAERNSISNAEFYADSAENIVPKLLAKGLKPNVIILDPPRKGSDETTLGSIINARPERIVYVSCDSATLARDARLIADNGYRITKAHGFDLFPHTIHAETVVLFER